MHPINSSTSNSLLSRAEMPLEQPLRRFPLFSNQSSAPSLGGRSQICETISQALSSLCQRIKRLVERIFSLFSSSTSTTTSTPSATSSLTGQGQSTETSARSTRTSSTAAVTTTSSSLTASTSIAQRVVPIEQLFGEPLNFSESPEHFAAVVNFCKHFSSCYTNLIDLSTEISSLANSHPSPSLYTLSPELLDALRTFITDSEALQNETTHDIYFSICGQDQALLVRNLKDTLQNTFPDLSSAVLTDPIRKIYTYCNRFLADYANVARQRDQVGAEYINSLIDLLVAEKGWRGELSTWLENNEGRVIRNYARSSRSFTEDFSSSTPPDEHHPFSWITMTAHHNEQRALLERLNQEVNRQNDESSSTSAGTSENPVAALSEPLRNYFYALEEFFYYLARARLPNDRVLRDRITSYVQYDFQTAHVMQSYQQLLQQIAPQLPGMRENGLIDQGKLNKITVLVRRTESLPNNLTTKSLFSDFAFWEDINIDVVAGDHSPFFSPIRIPLATFLKNANAFCALHYGMVELPPYTAHREIRNGTFFSGRELCFSRQAILYSNWHYLNLFYQQLLSNPRENNSLFNGLSTQTITALRASYQRALEQYGFETFPYPEDLSQLDPDVDGEELFRTSRQPFYATLIESLTAVIEQNPALQALVHNRAYTFYALQPHDLVDLRHMLTTIRDALTVPGAVPVSAPCAP